jgi:hypothetical protein
MKADGLSVLSKWAVRLRVMIDGEQEGGQWQLHESDGRSGRA